MNFKKRLFNKYGYDYPIFLSDLGWMGLSEGYIRSALSRLVKSGEIARFSRGIYFFQQETRFGKSWIQIPLIFDKKYVNSKGAVVGFYSGLNLENLLGLSTQIPATTEITTNATTKNRRLKVGSYRLLLIRPRVAVNSRNVTVLKFLNIVERLELTSFRKGDFNILSAFIKKNNLKKDQVLQIARCYPKQTLKKLDQTGLINELA
ncbi:MAG: type IV toxin-antitoxin system AbiEi family antitoxin domain-containing protein [Thermoguttaceae bacterium]|nr:type IV toxin-antitoxin system AbiEi family antitoxin domain-containing protein [Thermoguttaceae bacterium]